MSQQTSDVSIRSKGITIVAYIDYNTFLDTLSHFQADKEKFAQLRDQFLHDSMYQYPCESCGLFKHVIYNCPQLTYRVNKSHFLKQYYEIITQDRDKNCPRLDKKTTRQKSNSLINNISIRQELKFIRCDLANYFYSGQCPYPNFDSVPYLNYDDKQFLSKVPKINYTWFKNMNQEHFDLVKSCAVSKAEQQIHTNSLASPNGNDSDSDSESDTNSSESNTDQVISSIIPSASTKSRPTISNINNINNINNNNENKQQQLNENEIMALSTTVFGLNDQRQGNTGQSMKGDAQRRSDMVSEQKINDSRVSLNSMSQNQLPNVNMEDDALSPLSSHLISESQGRDQQTKELHNSKIDQNQVDQFHNFVMKSGQSLLRKQKSFKKILNQNSTIIGQDMRILSLTSLTKKMRDQSQLYGNNSYTDIFEMGFAQQNGNQGQSQINNSGVINNYQQPSGGTLENNSLSILNQYRGSHISDLLYDQFQIILDLVKQQQRHNERLLGMSLLSTKVRTKTQKGQDLLDYAYVRQRTASTYSKNTIFSIYPTILHDQKQVACNETENNNCSLFGKCGFSFETIKEYIYYYTKFNYSIVIRAYKKQQTLTQKRNRQQKQSSFPTNKVQVQGIIKKNLNDVIGFH